MDEYRIGYTFCVGLIGFAIAAVFYMRGGRNNKAQRRFLASAIIASTIIGCSLMMGNFTWKLIGVYAFTILEFIQGYSNNKGKGWIKRLGIAATSVLTGVYMCWCFGGGWWLLIPHAWASLGTVFFAIKNPIHAAAEEPLVMMMNDLLKLAYPFVIVSLV